MVVVTTTEAVPAAASDSAVAAGVDTAGADAVGEFAESLVAVSELEQADRISAEVARTPRSAIFFVVMMSI
jgi:hypothetical protein